MARPKLGASESKRLQMVITEDELEAVDNWRYANKVPSRSEAIRRLCQIALLYEQEEPQIISQARDLAKDTIEIADAIVAHAANADAQDMITLPGPPANRIWNNNLWVSVLGLSTRARSYRGEMGVVETMKELLEREEWAKTQAAEIIKERMDAALAKLSKDEQ